MITIDPAWAGKVQFYELLFGTWTVYITLVLMWTKVLRAPLPEWRYVLLNFFGAGAFWVNHYFQGAPFWMALLNLYTLFFVVMWWRLGVRGQPRSIGWKIGATLMAFAYTVLFIVFENVARAGVERFGVNEFWFMAGSFLGFTGVILWRGQASGSSVSTSR